MVRDHGNRLICRIDLMGLLAIMFVLVVAFLSEHAPVDPKYVSVDLAKVKHSKSVPRADREDAITVAVQRDGRIYFRTDPTVPENLPLLIRRAVDAGADPRVYLNADARARYGAVKEALDGIRDAHIDRITFLVDEVRR